MFIDRSYYYMPRKMHLQDFFTAFTRRKAIDAPIGTALARCLSTLDLTLLGIGSTLGVGVYVLAGSVARNHAGPAVIISFAIAAIASMMAGLCYAEFGARVPRAGSAYIYSYVTIGEFVAFLIGWTLILEYIIGSASVVRGLSTYVDGIFNNSMRIAFETAAPMDISHLSSYPDFFALGVTIVFSIALAFGAKESSVANNFFTFTNLSVVVFIIIAGAFKANFSNWSLKPACTGNSCKKGSGGFAPYGIAGILSGAAKCFYGFIGFDCVATTGEEAKNPQKSIPIAIIASLTVVFLAYVGVSTTLTTVLPYYSQDPDAPFPYLFDQIGWNWAKWIVTIGAICALCASLLGSMMPLPRIIYAMASDGLIFKWMGRVNSRFQTPMWGTLSAGLITGTLAAIFELSQLIDMMSIGTLLAYSIVAACVVILRYEENKTLEKRDDREPRTFSTIAQQFVNYKKLAFPTKLTANVVTSLILCYCGLCICLTGLIKIYSKEIVDGNLPTCAALVVIIVSLILCLVFVYLQPNSESKLNFTVPFVPFLPGLSILVNIYLMMELDGMTWIRFLIWMVIGFGIYFFYGMWRSNIRVIRPQNEIHETWRTIE